MVNIKLLTEEKRRWYKTLESIYCPILDEDVVFNSKGFYHLRYDSRGKQRKIKEQASRLALLQFVVQVIKQANHIHDYKDFESIHSGKRQEIWELRDFVDNGQKLISVILRRIGDGNISFFSVYER